MAGTLLGTLGIGITADLAGLSKGLDTASKSLNEFGQKTEKMGKSVSDTGKTMSLWVTGPIVAVATAVTALTVNVGQFADNLMTQSLQTGISAKSLQEWRYIATLCGVSADAAVTAIYGLSRRMAELENDTGEGVEALAKLGLTFEDIRGKSPEDVFMLLLDRLSTIPDVLERNSIASKTLGLGWKEVAPIIAAGSEEIERLRKEANELGVVISDEGIKAAADFDNAWDSITAQLAAAKNEMGIRLAPMMRDTFVPIIQNTVIPAIKEFGERLGAIVKWFGDLPESTQKTIIKIVALVAAIGPALFIIGKLVTAVGLLSQGLAFLFSHLSVATGALSAIIAVPFVAGITAFIGVLALFSLQIGETEKDLEELGYQLDNFNDKTSELERHWHDLLAMSWNDLITDLKAAGDAAGLAAEDYAELVKQIDAAYIQASRAENLEEAEALWRKLTTRILEQIAKWSPAMQSFVDEQMERLEVTADVTEQILGRLTEDVVKGFSALGKDSGIAFGEGLSIGLVESTTKAQESISAVGENALLAFQAMSKQMTDEAIAVIERLDDALAQFGERTSEAAEKIAQGYTPAFDELEQKVNLAIAQFKLIEREFGRGSVEFLDAWTNVRILYDEIGAISNKIYETQGLVNGALVSLEFRLAQETDLLAEQNREYEEWFKTFITARDYLGELGLGIEHMIGDWMSYRQITRTAIQATEEAEDSIKGMGNALIGIGGPLVDTIQKLTEFADRAVTAFSDVFGTFFDSVAKMRETNLELQADYEQTLQDLADAEGEAYKDAAEQRRKDKQDLDDQLTDNKITREQYVRELNQIEADFTRAQEEAAQTRTEAAQAELLAYEQQKRGIGDILSDMLHDFLRAAREQLQLEAAKELVISIAQGLTGNLVGAVAHLAASAEYLAGAAGLAISGFHSGGIVSSSLGEEPIIRAKAGEGVFTPEQMAAMGTIDYELMGTYVAAGVADALQELGVGADRPMILQVDGKTFGRIALPLVQREKVRLGLEAV